MSDKKQEHYMVDFIIVTQKGQRNSFTVVVADSVEDAELKASSKIGNHHHRAKITRIQRTEAEDFLA